MAPRRPRRRAGGRPGRAVDLQLGCRGTFKLNGGTARLAGATGEGSLIWRPSAAEFKKQLDGTVLENATGLLSWRDFKLKAK